MTFSLRFPTTFEELWPLLETSPPGSALPIAGGTDLLFALAAGKWDPRLVVSLSRLPFPGIEVRNGEVRIGGAVTLRAIEREPRIVQGLPALAEACADVGSVQLRHRATLAGNLVRASSASDLLPPLIALGAELVLRSRRGRRTVPLEGFVRGSWETELSAGEIVEEVRIAAPSPSAYRWQRVRPANDISQVGVCAARTKSRHGEAPWRLVAGGTSPTVQRLREAEARLTSSTPSTDEVKVAAKAAASEASFATDLRAAEDYRRRVVQVLVERSVQDALARASASRLPGRVRGGR